jgi:hypothetical protein
MSKAPDYDAIYRKANPRTMPYNIHCRQPELSNLWPIDQQKFKRIVDAALRAQEISAKAAYSEG